MYYRTKESLNFYVDRDKSLLPKDVAFKWKVKNSGIEAKSSKDLRGNIENDLGGDGVKEEITKYKGKHYVECYALKENIVIATDSIYVNIV